MCLLWYICEKSTFQSKETPNFLCTSVPLFLLMPQPHFVGVKPPDPQLQGGCVGINNDLSLSQEDMH